MRQQERREREMLTGRQPTWAACRNLVQAINAYKRQAVDTSLMDEGETLSHYATRLYAFGVWRMIMVSGITDWLAYRADDMLRQEARECEDNREAMMHHYHLYEDRLHMLTEAPDDYIDDIRSKAYDRHARKVVALVNAVTKEYRTLGVPHAEVCATLCVLENFVLVSQRAYRATVKPLGGTICRQLPTHAEDALRRLERCGDAVGRLLRAIDTEGLGEGRTANGTMTRLARELLESVVSPDELNRAAAYANSELKKAGKEGAR